VNAVADGDLLGVWQGQAGCDGVDPVPFILRIILSGVEGEPPLQASIGQAGSNTGVISQEIWGLARQGDGTYEGTPLLEEHTAVVRFARDGATLSGHVSASWGRCVDYDFSAFKVPN
jgi:hypothetical protein